MPKQDIDDIGQLSQSITLTMINGCYVNVLDLNLKYRSVCQDYISKVESGRDWKVCNMPDSQKNFVEIDQLTVKIHETIKKLLELTDDQLASLGKNFVNIPGDVLREYFTTYNNGLKDTSDIITYYYAPSSCDKIWHAYTTLGKRLSGVFFCDSYLSLPSYPVKRNDGFIISAFHVLAHELTHRYLSTTDKFEGNDIYGAEKCQKWTELHPPYDLKSPSNSVIADCITLLISSTIVSSSGRSFFIQFFKENKQEGNMIRREDILFNISAYSSNDKTVISTWSLTNLSPNNYYIGRAVILLDGADAQCFYITGPSPIVCSSVSLSSHHSGLVYLESGQTISSTVEISSVCFFTNAINGIYTIGVHSSFILYSYNDTEAYHKFLTNETTEFSWLVGQASFVIGENSEDLTLNSLTYESGL